MICRLDVEDDARVGWSGGTKTPSCRNDLILESRMGDEAEGDRRMIGSTRREEEDDDDEEDEIAVGGFLGSASPAEGAGRIPPLPGIGLFAPGRALRFRPRKVSAVLRTWENSYETSLASNSASY